MVEPPQQPFDRRHRPEIIGRRQHQHRQQTGDIDRDADHVDRLGIDRREHHQNGRGDDTGQHTDAVDDTVRDDLGAIVVPPERVGRGMDGGRSELFQRKHRHGDPGRR